MLPRLQALSGKVDGLLIGEGVVPATALARLARRLPVVVVAGDAGMRGVDVVAADNWSGAYALVRHLLIHHGRRRLYHVDGPPSAPDAKTRRLAMQAVIESQPGARLVGAHSGRFSVKSGEAAAEQMLADFGGPGSRSARRDRLLERPDGDRRPPHPGGARDPGAGRCRTCRF